MIASPPHNGSVTSHQDQLITPHNFNTINTIPSRLKNPIPLLLFDCAMLFLFIRFKFFTSVVVLSF